MTGVGHLSVGTIITTAGLYHADHALSAEFMFAVIIGSTASLVPDVDSADSLLKSLVRARGKAPVAGMIFGRKMRRQLLLKPFYHLFAFVERTIRFVSVIFLNLLSTILPHRGLTHYPLTALLLSLLFYWLTQQVGVSSIYALAFGLGYGSHLWADSITKAGIPLFGPLSKRRRRTLPQALCLRTGRGMSAAEMLTIIVVAILATASLLWGV